ncbi:6241_t:CDS:1, partial [Entrophospora sp. SA101]
SQRIRTDRKRERALEVRIAELEHAVEENTQLKVKVTKLEYDFEEIKKRTQTITNTQEAKLQISDSSLNYSESQVTSLPHCKTNDSVTTSITPITPEQIENTFDNAPNSDVCQKSSTRCYTSPICTEPKSLEDKEVDEFLDSVNKEKVSNEIRERNQEKKLLHESAINQDLTSDNILSKLSNLSCDTRIVPSGNDQIHAISEEPDFPKTEMSELEHDDEVDKNQIVEQGLIEELCSSTEIASAIENTSSTETSISCDKSEYTILGESETQSSAFSAQHLSCLFKTAIKSRQQEILNWYYYSLEFEKRVHAITADGKIKDKTARIMIYKEMKPFLPNITQDNLRKKTLRARKLLILFGKNGVGIDKIKRITYSANEISKLTNAQIQNIINHVLSAELAWSKTMNKIRDRSNSEVNVPDIKDKSETRDFVSSKPEIKVNVSSNPTRDHAYFRNKILWQFSDLYKTFSNKKFDYYGIIEGSLCPICKLNHEDGKSVKGKYEAGSYFIICGKREIEITA